jgi:hypothetical protein
VIPLRSRPKTHLINPTLDSSFLMPPRKANRRRSRSRSRSVSNSNLPEGSTSQDGEAGQSQADLANWKMPTRPPSTIAKPSAAMTARRSVRFNLSPVSSQDDSSPIEPMSEHTLPGLNERLVTGRSKAAYVEDVDTQDCYSGAELEGYLSASSIETDLGYRRKGGAVI